jgi:thioesterase domain-containing protein
VETLADSLNSQGELLLANGIVPIQLEGDEVPLFILSAGLYMRELAFVLGTTRQVFGLHPYEGGQLKFRESIQETAKIYYRNLVDFYPKGPYLLFGHSANGFFALELARQLRENGRTVAFLGLLDTYPPGPQRRANLIDRMKIHIANLQDKNLPEILQYIGRSARRFSNRWWSRVARDARTIERYEQEGQFKAVRSQLLRTYKPEPYKGQVTIFTATHRPWYMRWDPMEQWAKTLTGQLNIVPIPGDHMSVLQPPQVALLAKKIKALMPRHEND